MRMSRRSKLHSLLMLERYPSRCRVRLLKDRKGVLQNIQSYWIFNTGRFHLILRSVYHGPECPLMVPNLPLTLWSKEAAMTEPLRKRDFAVEVGALGYPGFSYLKRKMRRNPAEVCLTR